MNRFISNGDYMFPWQFAQYWAEHVYWWSYQQGAVNPDGVMRLPGRLLELFVFASAGNLAASYFYLLFCVAVTLAAFGWFARVFLDAERRGVVVIGALFFACNPIFLGNFSKIGLVLGVAMLPLMLTAIKQSFALRRLSYLFIWIAALNVSLIHPFTFTVNLLVSLAYFVLHVRRNRAWAHDKLWSFALMALTAVALNAYLVLPLVSMGTVDKSALSDTVTTAPADYTSLVDVANTGDVFTGLSLSKGVFKDYEFYNAYTWPVYFLGVFVFYVALFAVYVRVEKRAKPRERWRFVVSMAVFLILLVMATATFLHADVLIKAIISLPGGWMFRSPLKWQLYMPLALCTALVVALKHVRPGKGLVWLYAAFASTLVLMNAYLGYQITTRLLLPRTPTYFSSLSSIDLSHKNLLFVDSSDCTTFARDNPAVPSELTQVFISRDVQVKHVQNGAFETVNASQFDYVMGCTRNVDMQALTKHYDFEPTASYVEGIYTLYKNKQPQNYVSTATQLVRLPVLTGMSGKYNLVAHTLHQPFVVIDDKTSTGPASSMQGLFDVIAPKTIKQGKLVDAINAAPTARELHLGAGTTAQINDSTIVLAPQAAAGPSTLVIPSNQAFDVQYSDPAYTYQNKLQNSSFETELWQNDVGDCNNYDDKADIGMTRTTKTYTDGRAALELNARSHIACTSPPDVAVEPGQTYLLSFDYASNGSQSGGYYLGFDDDSLSATNERLTDTQGRWQPFSVTVTAPKGAHHVHMVLYAYPGVAGKTDRAFYDNVRLIRIPPVQQQFFVVDNQSNNDVSPQVTWKTLNPTKTTVHIKGAQKPFYLVTKESYHRLWHLQPQDASNWRPAGTTIGQHLRLNGTMNGWLIDPTLVCKNQTAVCSRQSDGSYDMQLTMRFVPQQWFYIGGMVSLAVAAASVLYIIFDIRRARRGEGT